MMVSFMFGQGGICMRLSPLPVRLASLCSYFHEYRSCRSVVGLIVLYLL